MRDLKSNIEAATLLASADNADTDKDSASVDMQGFNSVAFVLEVGTITGTGTVTPALEESTDDSTFTAVADADLIGSLSDLATDTDQKVSYNGAQRYVRLSTTVDGTVSAATYGVLGIQGNPNNAAV